MNTQVKKLYHIAKKEERLILGLMSGTSLDGLDLALCRVRGNGTSTVLELVQFITIAYSESFREQVRQLFAKAEISQPHFSTMNAYIGRSHADIVNATLQKWNVSADDVDLIASHGQTVYHGPKGKLGNVQINSTLQIGDGDHIAVGTGIITISDFRQKHIAAGGEGAPLVVYGDRLLFTADNEHRVLLNIGGIANFTFLPSSTSDLSSYCSDIGPGNTMMDQYMQQYVGQEMDRDAALAKSGHINQALLNQLLTVPFLRESFPKTTGPELFNLSLLKSMFSDEGLQQENHAEVMATLSAYTVETIVSAIQHVLEKLSESGDQKPITIYVSGGGLHNPLIYFGIKNPLSSIGVAVKSFEEIGFNPDAKEAALFAVLANETVAGSPTAIGEMDGATAVCMGKISFPF